METREKDAPRKPFSRLTRKDFALSFLPLAHISQNSSSKTSNFAVKMMRDFQRLDSLSGDNSQDQSQSSQLFHLF